MTDLLPPDRERCQALRPNKSWSPFNLGPADVRHDGEKVGGSRQVDRHWRCGNRPTRIVEGPAGDGRIGQMSLCEHCFGECCRQMADQIKVVEMIAPETAR